MRRYMDAMPNILRQMQLLWKKEFLSFLFAPLFAVTPAKDDRPVQTATMSGCSCDVCSVHCLYCGSDSSSFAGVGLMLKLFSLWFLLMSLALKYTYVRTYMYISMHICTYMHLLCSAHI